MQHFDNDMDELFRRAAEKYPLKKTQGSWERIAEQIGRVDSPPSLAPEKDNRKKYILLLLLLFLGTGSAWLLNFRTDRTGIISSVQLPGNDIQSSARDINPSPGNKAERLTSRVLPGKKLPFENPPDHSLSEDAINSGPIVQSDFNIRIAQYDQTGLMQTGHTDSRNPADRLTPERFGIRRDLTGKPGIPDLHMSNPSPEFQRDLHEHFYLGALAGPDLSRVKSQSVKRAGYNYGLIAGYRFNDHLSVETGIQLETKKYFSSGEHFKMDKVATTMPAGMKVMEVESRTRILEIPVSLKYDVLNNKRGDFYVTAGLSSYIVLKENNDYTVELNGNHDYMQGSYQKNSYSLPSALNLGMGYEFKFNNSYRLRVQPYLKIPLKGVGVGSLPVTSSGLHIGIIKSF